jgi:hypothetical protein
MAAGPSHLLVAVNSGFEIYNKAGGRQYTVTFGQWFSSLNPPSSIFDPKVVYDAHASRWVIVVLAVDDDTQRSYYLVSVSDDGDPIGHWWNWKLDAGLNGSTGSGLWADFPGLGYDSAQAVYLTSNQYTFPTDDAFFQYAKIRVLYKSQLYWNGSGQSLSWWDFWDLPDADGTPSFTVKPAQAGSPLAGEYFLNTRPLGGNAVTLWRMTNPLGSPPSFVRQATVSVGAYSPPPAASQANSFERVDTGDCRTQELWFQRGKLVTAFSEIHNWGSGNVSAIRALEIDSGSSALQVNTTFGANGLSYYYPALTRDRAGNLGLVFNRSGASEYVNCRYSVRPPSGEWAGSLNLRQGDGPYVNYGFPPGPRNRWGDYSAAALDPINLGTGWVFSEFSTTDSENWSTWLGQFALSAASMTRPEFNADISTELVWQNNQTGQRTIWLMSGTTWVGETPLPTVSPQWQIATTGDFNLDGQTDLLWQNEATGQRTIWLMDGTNWVAEQPLPTVSPQWQIAAAADFNADGSLDIVWQNRSTGQRTIWLMTGTTWVGETALPTVSPQWQIAGAADFSRDGNADILWQNISTGQRTIWLMNQSTWVGERGLPTVSAQWQIAGAADFNGNDNPDILWQNTATGQRSVWLMSGTSWAGQEAALPTVSPPWEIRNH